MHSSSPTFNTTIQQSPDFNGQMVLRSYLTGPGQNYNGGKLADAPEQYVRVSKARILL